MDLAQLSKVETLHHAYLVIGGAETGVREVVSLLGKRKVQTVGNPDFFSISTSEFTVDMARQISAFASLKPLGERKYVVVSWSRATTEAQNALLKSVEESGSTTFFFSIDSQGHALPTLRSRCIPLSVPREARNEADEEAESFVRATYAKRLAQVDKMISAISKTQDRIPARAFVRSLMGAFQKSGAAPSALRDILDADRYLRMQGGSAKSVLGHLAVSLPRLK